MGVLDNGTVLGVPPKAAQDMVKNFISAISNPLNFTPTIYLVPEILIYEGKTVIHVHIPASAEVHSYKKVIYDRLGDADIRVTATAQIAGLYIHKQNIFIEKKRNLYKYSKYYSGQEPEFKEGDVFRIVVPLDDEYSFDYAAGRNTTPQVMPQVTDYDKILERILKYCSIPRKKSEIMAYCDFKETKNFTKKYLRPLLDAGKITMTIPDKPKSQNQRYVAIENK